MCHLFRHRSYAFFLLFFLYCNTCVIITAGMLSLSSNVLAISLEETNSRDTDNEPSADEFLMMGNTNDSKVNLRRLPELMDVMLKTGQGLQCVRAQMSEQERLETTAETEDKLEEFKRYQDVPLASLDTCCCSNICKPLCNEYPRICKGIKYCGMTAGGAIVVFSLGINLLLVSTEDGTCGTIITANTALPKIWAIAGGGALSLTAVNNMLANVTASCIRTKCCGTKENLPLPDYDENQQIELNHKNTLAQTESKTSEDEAGIHHKNTSICESKACQIVLTVGRLLLALVDASRDAYISGSALECIMGGGIAFKIIGIALNGSVSFCIAYIGSTELLDLCLQPCKGGSSEEKKIYRISQEIMTCVKMQGAKEIEFNEKECEQRIRLIFDEHGIDGFFHALKISKVIREETKKALEPKNDNDCHYCISKTCINFKDCVVVTVVLIMALGNGIYLANIFSSETMLQDLNVKGLAINGSYVVHEAGGRCNINTGMPLIVMQTGVNLLSITAGWELVAYIVQGINVTMVGYLVIKDIFYMGRIIINTKDRRMFLMQPKRYFITRVGGIFITSVMVTGYSWNLVSSLGAVDNRNAILGCVHSPFWVLSKVPAMLSVSMGVSWLTLCFMYGWQSVSSGIDSCYESNVIKRIATPIQNWFSNLVTCGRGNCLYAATDP